MRKKLFKNLIVLATLLIVFVPVFAFAQQASAATDASNLLGIGYAQNIGLSNADPRTASISLIRLIMTFLGIIAVVIMLYGGFIWMTAAGNEDKVETAKKLIVAGIIGLIIILAAFLIVNFVVNNVSQVLNNS